MNSTRDRVISLLGQGFSQTAVAAACGVTSSWISQLVDEPEVREEIMRLRSGKLEEAVAADKDLDSLERQALKLVGEKLPFVRSPMEAARIFATLNKANRKMANSNPEQDAVSLQQVNIVLPRAAASIHIQLNSNNQVVEVEGRSMATLPSRALPSLAASRATEASYKAVPTVQDIKEATAKRLQQQDAVKASAILDSIKSVETVIDGVPCVL